MFFKNENMVCSRFLHYACVMVARDAALRFRAIFVETPPYSKRNRRRFLVRVILTKAICQKVLQCGLLLAHHAALRKCAIYDHIDHGANS